MDLPKTASTPNSETKSVLPPLPTEPEKPVTPIEIQQKEKTKFPIATIFALILVAILGVSLPIFFIWNSNNKVEQKGESKKITVDAKNNAIKQALQKEFVYTAVGKSDYYSPSLDAAFAFDRAQLSVSENTKSVSISVNAYRDLYAEMFFLDTTKAPTDYFKQEFGLLTSYKQSTVEQKEGYATFTFSYVNTPFDKKSTPSTIYYTVYYVKNETEGKYAVIKAFSRNEKTIPEGAQSLLTTMLTSVNMKPENVAAEITAELSDMHTQVKFDKKQWSVLSQSTNYLSLQLVTKASTEPTVYASFSSAMYKLEHTQAVLDKAQQDEVDVTKTYHANLKVTTDKKKTTINGKEAFVTTYTYSDTLQNVVKSYYVGWLPGNNGYFTISITKFINKTSGAAPTIDDTEIEKLLNGVTFQEITSSVASDISPNVLGDSAIQIDSPAIIGKLGTVHIATTMCAELSINDPTVIPTVSAMKFKQLCGTGLGSGFFVTEDGTIVTNSHVVANSPFYTMESLFINDDSPVFNLIANELANRILAAKPSYFDTKEAVSEFKAEVKLYILELIGQKKITFTNMTSASYMEVGTPFSYDTETGKLKNTSAYAELQIVKSNTLSSPLEHYAKLVAEKKSLTDNPFTFDVPDVAVVKVKTPTGKYPTLALANYNLITEGSKLFVIGFPGVAEGKDLYAKSSTMSATITTGTVSAIKPSVNNNFKLIQTDAGINPGNSGGPIINTDAKAIAISTYSQSSVTAGNYNSGVSIEEAIKMLSDAGITPAEGTITKNLKSGIQNLQKGYYTWAVKDFDAVLNDYVTANTLIQPFKLLAQEKINNGEDNTPITQVAGYYIHKSDLPYIYAGLGIVFVTLIGMMIAVLRRGGKQKQTKFTPPTQQPEQPMPTQGPVAPGVPVEQLFATPTAPTAPKQFTPPVPTPKVEQPLPNVNPIQATQTSTVNSPSSVLPPLPSELNQPLPVQPKVPEQQPVLTPTPAPTPFVQQPVAPQMPPTNAAQPVPTMPPVQPAMPAVTQQPVTTPTQSVQPSVAGTPTVQTQPTPQVSVGTAPAMPPQPAAPLSQPQMPVVQPAAQPQNIPQPDITLPPLPTQAPPSL